MRLEASVVRDDEFHDVTGYESWGQPVTTVRRFATKFRRVGLHEPHPHVALLPSQANSPQLSCARSSCRRRLDDSSPRQSPCQDRGSGEAWAVPSISSSRSPYPRTALPSSRIRWYNRDVGSVTRHLGDDAPCQQSHHRHRHEGRRERRRPCAGDYHERKTPNPTDEVAGRF